MHFKLNFVLIAIFINAALINGEDDVPQMPTKCEVCKLFSHEFMIRFNETDSSAIIETHDIYNSKIPYAESYVETLRSIRFLENCD